MPNIKNLKYDKITVKNAKNILGPGNQNFRHFSREKHNNFTKKEAFQYEEFGDRTGILAFLPEVRKNVYNSQES